MIATRRAAAAGMCVVLTALGGCSNTKGAANRETYSGSATAQVVDGVQQVRLTVGPSFRFDPSTITVHPGRVRVTLHHTGSGSPHNFALPIVPGASIPILGDNQTESVTFTAPSPGRYQFQCTIHLAQGQVGTLIVLPH